MGDWFHSWMLKVCKQEL